MKCQRSLKNPLLLFIFSGALFTFVKVTLFPATASHAVTSFSFPEHVSLSEWQFVSYQPLVLPLADGTQPISAGKYEYVQDGTPITIEMYYFVHTNGDVRAFLKAQDSNFQGQNEQYQHTDAGYYLLFVNQERAYLSACINPHGD